MSAAAAAAAAALLLLLPNGRPLFGAGAAAPPAAPADLPCSLFCIARSLFFSLCYGDFGTRSPK